MCVPQNYLVWWKVSLGKWHWNMKSKACELMDNFHESKKGLQTIRRGYALLRHQRNITSEQSIVLNNLMLSFEQFCKSWAWKNWGFLVNIISLYKKTAPDNGDLPIWKDWLQTSALISFISNWGSFKWRYIFKGESSYQVSSSSRVVLTTERARYIWGKHAKMTN